MSKLIPNCTESPLLLFVDANGTPKSTTISDANGNAILP